MNKKQSMTCIVIAKNKQGKLIIAGDRRASWGWSKAESMEVPKISNKDGVLLGATGDSDLCSLFVDHGGFIIPEKKVRSVNLYMFNIFKQAVHKFMLAQTFAEKAQLGLPPNSGVEVVIGIEGEAWSLIVSNPLDECDTFQSHISVSRVSLPYATGCGGIPALAVMKYEMMKKGYLSKQNIVDAVKIAAEISPGCDDVIDTIVED